MRLLAVLILVGAQVALGQTPVGETMCDCPGPDKPLGNHQSCEDACFGTRRNEAVSPPTPDPEVARQVEQTAAAERAREDEERANRLAAEKRQQDEFLRARDATTLKGVIGTSVSPQSGALKDTTVETGLKELRSVGGDLQGPQKAWTQLHCAASISGYAFAALSAPAPDYQESNFLLAQVSKAMAGERLDVECPRTPPMPELRGKAVDWERLLKTQQRMVERATTLSERIQTGRQARAKYEPAAPTADEQRIQEAWRQGQANEARLAKEAAPAIAAQRAINRKWEAKDVAAARDEEKARAEAGQYVAASKALEEGDPSVMLNLSITPVAAQKLRKRGGAP